MIPIKWKSKRKTVAKVTDMINKCKAIIIEKGHDKFPGNLFYAINHNGMFQNMTDVGVLTIISSWTDDERKLLEDHRWILEAKPSVRCRALRDYDHRACTIEVIPKEDRKTPKDRSRCRNRQYKKCPVVVATNIFQRKRMFGWLPVSMAGFLEQENVFDVADLFRAIAYGDGDSLEKSKRLEDLLCSFNLISRKLANMTLADLTNPNMLDQSTVPDYIKEFDWRYFVAVDIWVEWFLNKQLRSHPKSISSKSGYEFYRKCIFRLAEEIDLTRIHAGFEQYNPRLVQLAIWLMASEE